MALRKDPAVVAFRTAAFVRELADELGAPQVATVGRMHLHPNLVNVVPATADFTIDLRHTDNDVLLDAERRPTSFCSRRQLRRAARSRRRPGPLRSGRVRRFGRRLRRTGGPHPGPHCAPHAVRRRPRRADAGPCLSDRDDLRAIGERAGHNPAEYTSPTDLEAGANVLLQVMLELAAT